MTGLVRTAAGAEALAEDGIAPVMGDVRDAASVAEAVRGAEVVFHLAAAFRQAKLADAEYAAVNVEGTRNVLEAAARAGVRRFVHCSTVGVHGDTGTVPATETSPLGPLDDPYNRTKLEAEQLALELFRRTGMEGVVLRPSVGYGPGEPRYAKLFRSVRRGRFVMIGSGETLYNMVYISDVCDGVMRAAERPEAGGQIFILGGAENITLNTLVGMIAALVGGRVSRLRVPLRPIEWASRVCEESASRSASSRRSIPDGSGSSRSTALSTSARRTAYWGTPPRSRCGRVWPAWRTGTVPRECYERRRQSG